MSGEKPPVRILSLSGGKDSTARLVVRTLWRSDLPVFERVGMVWRIQLEGC